MNTQARYDISNRLRRWGLTIKKYKERGYIKRAEFEKAKSVIWELMELSKIMGSQNEKAP